MPGHYFTTKQVLELVPMGYASLNDLVRRGVIVPSTRRGVGRGVPSLYDIYDLVGIAAVDFVRPKATSTTLMSSLYAFWHTAEGRQIVDNASKTTDGFVVLDAKGRVSYEVGDSIRKLFEGRQASMLHIVRPHPLVQQLFVDYAERQMVEPLESGRLPRKPRPVATEVTQRRGERAAPTNKAKRRQKKLPVPALVREAGKGTPGTKARVRS